MDKRPLLLDNQLCFALYAATNAIVRSYRPLLAAIDLTYPQYIVMLTLWQDGPGSTRHIADRLRLAPNAITPLIDRLEVAGFVRRERDTRDRRVVHVKLTDKGAELRAAASEAQYHVACATGLDDCELDEMRDALHALTDRLELPEAEVPHAIGQS
ncbi:MarR family transcriptional regulator [Rhodobacteraceae bacterium 2CG4]|uniref:MarR family transcriptional regulator n=1 Tax=Halovulum marinum TaxID=2662447 RepID=A0A6L5YW49_9RHOB|nr:MarR family winged helix-turn-helix transcriptional regulator [Halovulum marinum]MSU88531.1 MarR family transcriptional regulator [Halovulum marinum]